MTAARRPLWKTQQIRSTKIVRLTGGEYVVRAYGRADDGTVFKIPSADYFTGDRQDARDTAAAMVAPKIVNAVPAADAPGETFYRPACGSGWTNDRCTKKLGHGGRHSNEGGRS